MLLATLMLQSHRLEYSNNLILYLAISATKLLQLITIGYEKIKMLAKYLKKILQNKLRHYNSTHGEIEALGMGI